HPDHHGHGDAPAPQLQLRAVAGEPARAARERAAGGSGQMNPKLELVGEPDRARRPEPALRLNDVAVQLAGRLIFSGVNLIISRGEFIAVLGPNGAGKSTLMRAILGLQPLAAGTAQVLGRAP